MRALGGREWEGLEVVWVHSLIEIWVSTVDDSGREEEGVFCGDK